jgi:DNA-binding MarR family transcriptional regulator
MTVDDCHQGAGGFVAKDSKRLAMTSEGKGMKTVGRRAVRSISNTPPVNRRTAHELVDAIFQQWQTERPDINATPVHIYGLIGQIHLQATAFINEVLEPLGLVRGTFDVLTALRRAGAPYALTPKQLATSLLLSGAGLTSRLNRLEALHFIARLPEPSDRRTVRVQLTTIGEALINEAIPLVFEAQWLRLRPLGADNQSRLIEDLARFADVISAFDGPRVLSTSQP